MCNESRESLLFLAKLAEQSERFEGTFTNCPSQCPTDSLIIIIDMMEYMKKVAIQSGELTVDERNMFSVAFKNVIGSRRASWRIISSLEQKEESKGIALHISCIKEYHAKIEKELENICSDVLTILSDNLLAKASTGESKVFYYKMYDIYSVPDQLTRPVFVFL